MDIKILDSHLREHLKTTATPQEIAQAMSLTSASIERVEKFDTHDWVYTIEVTTNRPDMVSVVGIAREAATILPSFGHKASLISLPLPSVKKESTHTAGITVHADTTLVRRIMGVVLEVKQKESPQFIKDRLEAADIRSLSNIIDITNYVMLEIGHPSHAFDYDRLRNHTLNIRQSKKGEKIITLDKKEHTLPGGDIVADNGEGEIVDLLGIMGTDNSVVTNDTKRILFFFDNNDPWRIRKTSMGLAIRTDAAALNEKGIDPELTETALLRGVELYKKYADATVISDILDIYPDKPKKKNITLTHQEIERIMGVSVPIKRCVEILASLGFEVRLEKDVLHVSVPTWREQDIVIEEDIVEEVARIYGYHNIPTALPPFTQTAPYHMSQNPFFWEHRVKELLKDLGWTEVYTYSMVSETLFEGPLEDAVTLQNPLDADHVHMRASITPSLLEVLNENKSRETIKIFEIANIYQKQQKNLPQEIRTIAGIQKHPQADFYHIKGLLEEIAKQLSIGQLVFKQLSKGGLGADVYIKTKRLGEIEILEKGIISFELNFDEMVSLASLKKTYTPLAKYPPIMEDLSLTVESTIPTGDLIDEIQKQSALITSVTLLDSYQNTRTFHIVYQDKEKNLTTEDIAVIREKIIKMLQKEFNATIK